MKSNYFKLKMIENIRHNLLKLYLNKTWFKLNLNIGKKIKQQVKYISYFMCYFLIAFVS